MINLGSKTLETKHLLLREHKVEDYKQVYNNYANSEIVTKYLTWKAHENEEVTKDYLKSVEAKYGQKDVYYWAIVLKESNEVIGGISSVKNDDVCAELGYCLGVKYWNKGYMQEAAIRVIDFFFEEVGFNVVLGRCIKENLGSKTVMEKAGLKLIGEVEEDGKDLYLFKATKENYKANRLEYLLNKIYKKDIRNFKYYTFGYQKDYHKNEQICYGYIPFLDSINPEIIVDIIPDTYKYNRPGIKREYTKYITIHDTASASPTAGAKAHNSWIHNMANDKDNRNSVSWHYTIADKDIYQHMPLDEVAYHAGDGTYEKLEFFDSGIKEDRECKVGISSDGYYTINNQKSLVKAPLKKDGSMPTSDNIPYNGIGIEINENRNFSIGKTWWSESYQMIGNRGGNLNSIGIETCVNVGSNYINTMRNTAYIVGQLIEKFDLTVNSVKQHNYFSGKDCPMTIRHANLWEEFIDIVKIEKYRNEIFSDAVFKFESLDKEYLADDGNIIKYEEGKEVSYKVEISFKNSDLKYEYVYTSKLGKCEF